jgi:hypothetical protein
MGWGTTTTTFTPGTSSESSESTIELTAHMPPMNGDALGIWEWFMQFIRAIAEREAVARGAATTERINWPQSNTFYDGTTIDSYVDNGDGTISFSMTIPAGDWDIDCPHPPTYRWVDYSCFISDAEGYACVPLSYKLVIDPALIDPSKVVEMFISAQTYTDGSTTGVLTGEIGPILDLVTAGILSGLDELIGAPWCIIDSNGVYASDRIPTKPLQRQRYAGSCVLNPTSSSSSSSDSSSSLEGDSCIYDEDAQWDNDQWVGDDVLYWDTRLKRRTVIANTSQRVYFYGDESSSSSEDENLETTYCICTAGNITYPGAPQAIPYQWYYGAGEGVPSHSITDIGFGNCVLAAQTVPIIVQDDEGDCGPVDESPAFDLPDVTYSTVENSADNCMCIRAGQFYSPYVSVRRTTEVESRLVPRIDVSTWAQARLSKGGDYCDEDQVFMPAAAIGPAAGLPVC